MKWLYLDESGDLGFGFINKKPSKYFTICILMVNDRNSFVQIEKAVLKTIRNKLKKRKNDPPYVLKGSKTDIKVKRYFFRPKLPLIFHQKQDLT